MNYIKSLFSSPLKMGKYVLLCMIVTSIAAFLMLNIVDWVAQLLIYLQLIDPYEGIFIGIAPPSLWDLIFQYLKVGIWEEGAFRYLILGCLFIRFFKMRFWSAAIISSILFGLAHFLNATDGYIWYTVPQVVGASFFGLFMAYLYKRWGLHLAMLAHFLYDLVLSYILYYYIFSASLYLDLWSYLGGLFLVVYLIFNLKKLHVKKIKKIQF